MIKAFSFVAGLMILGVVSGCSSPVPSVPDPVPLYIEVDEGLLSQEDFHKKYCQFNGYNKTCIRVREAMNRN